MNISEARVGMKVFFGRINGEQTLGEIVKVNAKCAKIRQLEQRGVGRVPAGTIWRVPYYFVSSAEGQMSGLGTSPEVDRFRRAFLTDFDRNNQSWLKTHTYKTVNVNDIIGDYHKEKVWEAIANSEISFGSNHDTLIHPNTLLDIVEDAVYTETTGQNDTQLQEIKKRIHYMQENNILVSLGS